MLRIAQCKGTRALQCTTMNEQIQLIVSYCTDVNILPEMIRIHPPRLHSSCSHPKVMWCACPRVRVSTFETNIGLRRLSTAPAS